MAFSNDGVEAFQGRTHSHETIARYMFGGAVIKIFDDVTVDVTEYHGLNETRAKARAAELESASGANTMSDYRVHGPASGGVWPWWVTCPDAQGVRTTAACRRNGTSRMFTITVTKETHTCSCSDSTAVEY